jgi:hypothetical protein
MWGHLALCIFLGVDAVWLRHANISEHSLPFSLQRAVGLLLESGREILLSIATIESSEMRTAQAFRCQILFDTM